jgi:hypothetical protein
MSIKETEYKNFGKCVELTNGGLKALVTVDIGPRIIYYGTEDGRNVFFEDVSREVKRNGGYFEQNFKKGETWYLYGGHRMWKAPEDDATYIPDNYPVEYEIKKNLNADGETTATLSCEGELSKTDADGETAVFIQNIQKNTGLRFRLEVAADKKGGLKVRHILENVGPNTVNAAIWGISVLKGGGFLAVSTNTADTGFLPNNNFSFWPYDDMNDERLSFVGGYLVLKHDTNAKKPFKIGLNCRKRNLIRPNDFKNSENSITFNPNCEKQAAVYSNNGLVFVKKFDWQNGAAYPDGNCNFESYTSDLVTELEALSPVFSVEPNRRVEHTEEFSIFERSLTADKESLDAFFENLF